MEKYAIEVETSAGWVTYHNIMRPGEEKAREVLKELQKQFPKTNFRIVKWSGSALE